MGSSHYHPMKSLASRDIEILRDEIREYYIDFKISRPQTDMPRCKQLA